MDARYVNLFIEALGKTLEQFGVVGIKRTNIKKKGNLYVDSEVSSLIQLDGGIQGNIVLSMSQDTAKSLASIMMMGMSVTVIDEIAKSAIGELSGIIAGTSSTMLVSLGISLKISPPVVIFESCNINAYETLAVDFETHLGRIEFNIGFI